MVRPNIGMELLLIAQSARILAQSAIRAGIRAYTIDLFSDSDTRQYAEQCVTVLPTAEGFDEASLLSWANDFAQSHRRCAIVYGSGIDARPLLVEKLAQIGTLLGNHSETLDLINNPRNVFPLLNRLGIPYPETHFVQPLQTEGLIVKPICGQGGKGVVFFANNLIMERDAYFQRFVGSDVFSLLFLAHGREIQAIGFNTQWCAKHDTAQPFLFAGAINRADLIETQRLAVEHYARALTIECGLVGLNSLDFAVENGECLVLELNPRPSATMALYDEDFHQGLLALHLAACQGNYIETPRQTGPVRAMRIVYSPSKLTIPAGFSWPAGCADIPDANTLIEAGQPLCTVHVRCENRQDAEILVKLAENELILTLYEN